MAEPGGMMAGLLEALGAKIAESISMGFRTASSAATGAAAAYAATGSSEDMASSVNRTLLDAAKSLPGGAVSLAATGFQGALDVSQRAGSRVSGVTEDLARYGVTVSDDYRKQLTDTAIEQERRVERERARVSGLVNSIDVIDASRSDASRGAPGSAQALLGDGILHLLREISEKIAPRGGG